MDNVQIKIKRLPNCEDISLPTYMSKWAAGMDLFAAVKESLKLVPGDWVAVSTGFSMALPPGFEAQIRPRSGLSLHCGISLMNSPGTIDADYRGEVRVIVVNHGKEPFIINRGDRIAQMSIQRVYTGRFEVVEDLSETERADGGFGHTGI